MRLVVYEIVANTTIRTRFPAPTPYIYIINSFIYNYYAARGCVLPYLFLYFANSTLQKHTYFCHYFLTNVKIWGKNLENSKSLATFAVSNNKTNS